MMMMMIMMISRMMMMIMKKQIKVMTVISITIIRKDESNFYNSVSSFGIILSLLEAAAKFI